MLTLSAMVACLCVLAMNCGPRMGFCPGDERALCLDGNSKL